MNYSYRLLDPVEHERHTSKIAVSPTLLKNTNVFPSKGAPNSQNTVCFY